MHHTLGLDDHFSIKRLLPATVPYTRIPLSLMKKRRNELWRRNNLIYLTETANTSFQWMNGAEWLYNHSVISNFEIARVWLILFSLKDIYARQWFAFSQAQYAIHEKWTFTAGLSLNNQSFRFRRLTDPDPFFADRKISLVVTPRLAVLYRLTNNISLYALAAKGFRRQRWQKSAI